MDAAVARSIAYAEHLQSRDRHGEPIVEHVARVAAAVPPEARSTAWLHDLLETTPVTLDQLRQCGLTPVEAEALMLLTRDADESYELYVLRIAYAPGPGGRLARAVKLADLDDHLKRVWANGDPPYGWARHHVGNAVERKGEAQAREPATDGVPIPGTGGAAGEWDGGAAPGLRHV
jgi:hypothetical protein